MDHDDISQIRVNNHTVGIIGLRKAMQEVADAFSDYADDDVGEELIKRLQKKNYIPHGSRNHYRDAFIREFRKFLGKTEAESESHDALEVKVLGPGCAQCDKLEQELMAVMAEAGIAADLEHVRDVKEIGRYGVMAMPALIINGKVKSAGKVPSKSKLREWLEEAKSQIRPK